MQINSAIPPDYGLPQTQTAGKNEQLKTEDSAAFSVEKKAPEKISETQKAFSEREISVSFSLDDRTNEIVIKLLDDKTGEVFRQIPTEVSLRMAAAYEQWQEKFSNQKS